MSQDQNVEVLWSELTSIGSIDDRRVVVYNDKNKKSPKYQVLAEKDPERLFELLGGDDAEIEPNNWAFEYTYEDYIAENDLEYDPAEAELWDVEEKSVEHAHDTGHWYVSGTCVLSGPGDVELPFEFEFCEGYLEGITGTPYNEEEQGNHGILFF